MVDWDDDAAPDGDRLRLLGSRRARVPLRRRHAARRGTPDGAATPYRAHVDEIVGAVPTGRRRPARARDAGSTRCSRRTCSCSGSTLAPATRTPVRTCSTTAGSLLLRAFNGLGPSHFPWSAAVAGEMPYPDVLAAFVLDGVDLRVTDFGTSVTSPEDYLSHVVEFAFFDVALGRARADRRRRRRRARGRGQGRATPALPQDRGDGTPRQDRRGRVRVLHVPAAVRRARGRRARLDRAARQHRPLPVPRAHRRRACPAASAEETVETYYPPIP